jgi:hypothetical protein
MFHQLHNEISIGKLKIEVVGLKNQVQHFKSKPLERPSQAPGQEGGSVRANQRQRFACHQTPFGPIKASPGMPCAMILWHPMGIINQVILGFLLTILAQVDPTTRNLPFIGHCKWMQTATQIGQIDRFMPPRKLRFMSKWPD